MKLRLVQPEYTIATSDGIRNGTREMRYSLIGREVTHDALCEHLEATGLAGTIAVVACNKPPVGTLAALLEHNQPAIDHVRRTDTSRPRPADWRGARHRQRLSGCCPPGPGLPTPNRLPCLDPGIGSCGGMFTYNTMAENLSALSACSRCTWWRHASDDPRRQDGFPAELVEHLVNMMETGLRPRDIVVRDSLRNAMIVAMAIGGSTNVRPARARDRARCRLWRLLEGGHDPGGVQPPVAACRASAHRRATIPQVFDGRHRSGRRSAGYRDGSSLKPDCSTGRS